MKTFLFDLDGTLLPMDYDGFVEAYFSSLTKKVMELKLMDGKLFGKCLWAATNAMITNDGSISNEEIFWKTFKELTQLDIDRSIFDDYYRNEFKKVLLTCKQNEYAKKIIAYLKEAGYTLILATNPIFPALATNARIEYAGLCKDDFKLVTTYENFQYCKPNLAYYREIVNRLNLEVSECIMIGNDVDEDMVSAQLGMQTILVDDYLINRQNKSVDTLFTGSLAQVYEYIKNNY